MSALTQAIDRLKAQIHWLRNGTLLDACPMMAVADMEVLLATITNQGRDMNDHEKAQRRDELAKRIAYANALGVRAEVVGDAAQRAEAARIYAEAMEELRALDAGATS